jgi:hypothetical protein
MVHWDPQISERRVSRFTPKELSIFVFMVFGLAITIEFTLVKINLETP